MGVLFSVYTYANFALPFCSHTYCPSFGKGDLARLGGTLQGLIGYLSSVSEEFHNLVEYAGKIQHRILRLPGR